MEKLKTDGLIFDMDGTVWDNTPLFAKSWTRAILDSGFEVDITPVDLKNNFGKTMEEIADNLVPSEIPQERYDALRLCEKYEMDDLVKSDEDTTYPGLAKTIEELSKRIPLYVVSNCQVGYIETFYQLTGLGKYFKGNICYGDNGLGKADNLKVLCQEFGIKKPLYVGDIQGDLNACNQAGVPFIWASYGYGASVDSYVAKLESITDLLETVEYWEG